MGCRIRSKRGGKPTERRCRWDFRHCVHLCALRAVCACADTCPRVRQCACVCVRVFECVTRGFSRPRGLVFLHRRPPAPDPSHSVGDTHPRGDQARLVGCDMAMMGPWVQCSAGILKFLIILSLNLGFVSDGGRDNGQACHFSAIPSFTWRVQDARGPRVWDPARWRRGGGS